MQEKTRTRPGSPQRWNALVGRMGLPCLNAATALSQE